MTARRDKSASARSATATAQGAAAAAADTAAAIAAAADTAGRAAAADPAAAADTADQATAAADTAPRRRHQVELNLLRPIPGDTAMHRLWAGTKLVALATLALVLGLKPLWPVIAAGVGLITLAWIVARIPRGALPRLPRWFWVGIALGAFLSLRSSATPINHLGGIAISWGGLEDWARIVSLALTVFIAAALMSWTTPLAEVAPALARLGTPLRWLRLPIDEWAATIALSIRCLPLLIEEVRTLAAARRLRPTTRMDREFHLTWVVRESQDLLFTTLAVSLRRATELGEAMEARGGFGTVSDTTSGPRWRDLVALVLVAGVVAVGIVS
jgi:energy-coupling factor transporter transmembrane protein EcfT